MSIEQEQEKIDRCPNCTFDDNGRLTRLCSVAVGLWPDLDLFDMDERITYYTHVFGSDWRQQFTLGAKDV